MGAWGHASAGPWERWGRGSVGVVGAANALEASSMGGEGRGEAWGVLSVGGRTVWGWLCRRSYRVRRAAQSPKKAAPGGQGSGW